MTVHLRFLLMGTLMSVHGYALDKLPNAILGFYQSNRLNPEHLPTNLINFVKFIGGPDEYEWKKINIVFYAKEDQYFSRFAVYPNQHNQTDLPFRLGVTNKATINGKKIKYLYTADGDENNVTVHMNFSEENDPHNFSIEAVFNESGIQSILGEKFFRILPPYATGAFKNDPEKTSPESRAVCNSFIRFPKASFSWNDKLQVWIDGDMSNGVHLTRSFVHPYIFHGGNFVLGEKQQVKCKDGYAEANHRLTESSLDRTVMRIEVDDTRCPFLYEMTFDRNGSNYTAIINGTKYVCGIFKRIVIPYFHGTFKRRPDSSTDQKWTEFVKGYEEYFQIPGSVTLEQNENDYHLYDKSGGNIDWIFQLGVPQEIVTLDGKLVKYTVTAAGSPLIHVDVEFPTKDIKYAVRISLYHHNMVAEFLHGNQSASQWFDQVASATVFGTFESVGEDTEEYKAFAHAMGTPELLNKTYVEFVNSSTTVSLVKQLVRPSPKFSTDYTYEAFYVEVDGVPHITSPRGDLWTPGRDYVVTSVIHPDGFSAYYSYGGKIQSGGEKMATRQFKRVGPGVKI